MSTRACTRRERVDQTIHARTQRHTYTHSHARVLPLSEALSKRALHPTLPFHSPCAPLALPLRRPRSFGWSGVGTGLFYVTFILLMQIILTNVVVAVLLEKMVADDELPTPPAATAGGKSVVAAAQQQAPKGPGRKRKGYSHKARVGAVARSRSPLPRAMDPPHDGDQVRAPALVASSAMMAQCVGGYAGDYAAAASFTRGGDGGCGESASGGVVLCELAALHERVDGVQETLLRMDDGIESMREQMERVERTLSALASASGITFLRRV